MVDEPQVPSPKEQKEILSRIEKGVGEELVPIVERKAELGPEVKDWMTKLETGEEIQLSQTVRGDSGQVLVEPAANQQPKIVLPLDEDQMVEAMKKKVNDSIRWLAEWCRRLLKMLPGRAEFGQVKS